MHIPGSPPTYDPFTVSQAASANNGLTRQRAQDTRRRLARAAGANASGFPEEEFLLSQWVEARREAGLDGDLYTAGKDADEAAERDLG